MKDFIIVAREISIWEWIEGIALFGLGAVLIILAILIAG